MGKVNRPPSKYKAKRLPVPELRHELGAIMQKLAPRIQFAENGCTEWIGPKNALGYGTVHWGKRRSWMVHRLVYAAHHGPYDPWLDVRHSCDNPGCLNIDHLSLGTRSDNMRDSVDRKRSKNAKKTHCPAGHPYEVYGRKFKAASSKYGEWRHCKACMTIRYRLARGWPEHLAKQIDFKVPAGYMIDRETGHVISVKTYRAAKGENRGHV